MNIKEIDEKLKDLKSLRKHLLSIKHSIKEPRYIKTGIRYPLNDEQKALLDKLNSQPISLIPIKDLPKILNSTNDKKTLSKQVRDYLNLNDSKLAKIKDKVVRVIVIGK